MAGLGQLFPAAAKTRIPPLDLLSSAAVLRERSLPFHLIECLGEGIRREELLNHIRPLDASIIAIRTSLPSLEWDLAIAGEIKSELPAQTQIILFGPCLQFCYREALQVAAIDAILIGEPELAMASIAAEGLSGQRFLVTRISLKKGDEPESAIVSELDDLPFPAWDLVPFHAYFGAELMGNLTPFATVLTSRGCPHGCLYCPYPVVQGKKPRFHSVDRVVQEIKWLQNNLQVRAILFRDPEFAIKRNRVKEFCRKIVENGIHVAWRCETRVENLDADLLHLMAEAGCIGINIGVESLDETVLSSLGRNALPIDHVKGLISCARKLGIEPFVFFILGLPGETIRSTLQTISSAVSLGCQYLQFTIATPYPGTALRALAIERGYIVAEGNSKLTGYNAVMGNGHLNAADITDLYDYAWNLWLLRKENFPLMNPLAMLRWLKQSLVCFLKRIKLKRRSRYLNE